MIKAKKYITWIQSVLIVAMMGFVTMMMLEINALQGTARVINYAGIVRGATQRVIKLEVTENPDDELIAYLDDILNGLRFGGGKYHLVSLNDDAYQNRLQQLMTYWGELKAEIHEVREVGYENTDIVSMSETYFHMADETVSAAEEYSQSIATVLRYLEFVSTVDILILIVIMIARYAENVKIRHRNIQLEQQVYTDQHTGLPNKRRCDEFFSDPSVLNAPIACIVFDLNNLKKANDTLGHSVGDQLIANFARLLRNAIPAPHFAGRYGGDEFMAVIYDATREKTEEILNGLQSDVVEFNRLHHGSSGFVEISYAHGCALSSDYPDCSFRVLFDQADKKMYRNKMADRKGDA